MGVGGSVEEERFFLQDHTLFLCSTIKRTQETTQIGLGLSSTYYCCFNAMDPSVLQVLIILAQVVANKAQVLPELAEHLPEPTRVRGVTSLAAVRR